MDISLSNNLENILKAKVAEGTFSSMDEAITFAIQFTFVDNKISQERIDALNKEIEIGWQAMENGDVLDGQLVMEEFRKKYAS